MREILFKAKPKNWKIEKYKDHWVEGYYAELGVGDDTDYYIIQNFSVAGLFENPEDNKGFIDVEIDPETVCQSVERADDCKRMIFEGDIVELGDRGSGIIGKVFYNKEMSCFSVAFADGDVDMLTLYDDSEVRVIGNIFDNPELLKGK